MKLIGQWGDEMIIADLPLPGLKLIEIEKRGDERGFFARTYCADEFAGFIVCI